MTLQDHPFDPDALADHLQPPLNTLLVAQLLERLQRNRLRCFTQLLDRHSSYLGS